MNNRWGKYMKVLIQCLVTIGVTAFFGGCGSSTKVETPRRGAEGSVKQADNVKKVLESLTRLSNGMTYPFEFDSERGRETATEIANLPKLSIDGVDHLVQLIEDAGKDSHSALYTLFVLYVWKNHVDPRHDLSSKGFLFEARSSFDVTSVSTHAPWDSERKRLLLKQIRPPFGSVRDSIRLWWDMAKREDILLES